MVTAKEIRKEILLYRTFPSVFKTVKKQFKTTSSIKVYSNDITTLPPHLYISVKQPRDIRQVENV